MTRLTSLRRAVSEAALPHDGEFVPAYEKLREFILGADVVGADETWWRVMGTKGKPSSSKK